MTGRRIDGDIRPPGTGGADGGGGGGGRLPIMFCRGRLPPEEVMEEEVADESGAEAEFLFICILFILCILCILFIVFIFIRGEFLGELLECPISKVG